MRTRGRTPTTASAPFRRGRASPTSASRRRSPCARRSRTRRSASGSRRGSSGRRRRSSSRSTDGTWSGSSLPALDEIGFGSYEGGALADYRSWAWSNEPDALCPGGGESRVDTAERIAGALDGLLGRPEETILAVSHALPSRYILDASDGSFPAARIAHVPHATPFALDADAVELRGRDPSRLGRGAAVRRRRPLNPGRDPSNGSPLRALPGAGRRTIASPSLGAACGSERRVRIEGDGQKREPRHTSQRGRLDRVEAHVRANALIEPGGEVTCLVSGGADSTCLWHVLRELGYAVDAVHVHHGLRGAEADADASHCVAALGADVVRAPPANTEAELRELRYALTAGTAACAPPATRPRTRSRRCSTASCRAARREGSERGARTASCGRSFRSGARRRRRTAATEGSRGGSTRRTPRRSAGLIRERILPLLEELEPRARANLLALGAERAAAPATARGVARRAALVAGRHALGRPRRRDPRRARIRHAPARGHGAVGPVAPRERPARARRALAAAGRPSRWPDA